MNNQKQPDQPLWPYVARNLDVRWLGSIYSESMIQFNDRTYYRLTVAVLARLIRAIEALANRSRSNGDIVDQAAHDQAAKGASILSPLIDWMSKHSGEPESAWEAAWRTGGSLPDDGRLVWELQSIDLAVGAVEASREALDRWVEAGGICSADIDAGDATPPQKTAKPKQFKMRSSGPRKSKSKPNRTGASSTAGGGLW